MLTLIVAFALAPPAGPLDRLPGKWASLESVTKRDGSKGTLRLRGANRWIFPGELLEISETYRVDAEKEEGHNHILVRALPDGKLTMWWYLPKVANPLVFDGTSDDKGMVFTQQNGRLKVSYVWDGNGAYDAKLESKGKDADVWQTLTVARYTRRR